MKAQDHFSDKKAHTEGGDKLRRLATLASLSVAGVLIIVKLTAYIMTDSVALLSSLLDSGVDFIAALLTAYGVASAMRPPDHDHRYGHGKAESLAALAQAAIIVGSTVMLGWQAIDRFYHPRAIENDFAGYGAMGVAIVLTLGLIAFQQYVVRKTSSVAIGADRTHYMGDLAVNVAVIAAFVLRAWTGFDWIDPVFAVGIVTALLISAFQILRESMRTLMDSELPEEQRTQICNIAEGVPGVKGIHDLRTRSDGDNIFIDCHVEMDGDMSLRAAHELSVRITTAIIREIPNADVTIHQDPAGLVEERLDNRIERLESKG
jgi:ferrous-iron efflux pump FieF